MRAIRTTSTAAITVGAGRIAKQFGFDANVGVRTMLARSELGLGGRMMLADSEPFSAARVHRPVVGRKLLDDSQRNGVTWDVGVLASLTALTHVTITGRALPRHVERSPLPDERLGPRRPRTTASRARAIASA